MKSDMKKNHPNYTNLTRFLIGAFFLLLIFLSGLIQGQEQITLKEFEVTEQTVRVITNRQVLEQSQTQITFESSPSKEGMHTYLLASQVDDDWAFEQKNGLLELLNTETTHKDYLVFIHGDGKNLMSAVERALEIQTIHKVNVLVYAWPSKDEDLGAIKNFKNSVSNIDASIQLMSAFLEELKSISAITTIFDQHNLTVFHHSLGNYYAEKLVEEGYAGLLSTPFIENLIINAAAVEQEGHSEWLEQINFSQRIFVNSNDDDMSLSGLRVLTKLGRQLGESAKPPLASNAIYVDFTDIVGFPGMGPSHSYYFAPKTMKIEKVKNYYSTIFHGLEPPHLSNQLLVSNTILVE